MKQNTLQIITAAAFALSAGSAVVVAQSKTGAAMRTLPRRRRPPDKIISSCSTSCAHLRRPGACCRAPAAPQPSPPDRSQWHVEPVKVFDNLYFVGQSEFSAWAVKTSAGIILVDTIFDYSVEDEVVGGLKKLGLDPAQIKYAIVSHGHGDHSGGAKYLQDHFGTRIILSAADWDLLDRSTGTRPKRDMVAPTGRSSHSARRR